MFQLPSTRTGQTGKLKLFSLECSKTLVRHRTKIQLSHSHGRLRSLLITWRSMAHTKHSTTIQHPSSHKGPTCAIQEEPRPEGHSTMVQLSCHDRRLRSNGSASLEHSQVCTRHSAIVQTLPHTWRSSEVCKYSVKHAVGPIPKA